MDRRKWFPESPLFAASVCCYCGGPADTSDHTPPRCLLPKKLPTSVQAMTIPACSSCNGRYALDESHVAAVVCTVSFKDEDREAVMPGGWVASAMQRDASLDSFIKSRLGDDGIFRPDAAVASAITRVMEKTVTGLLFHEFGRVIAPEQCTMLAIDHVANIDALALIEQYRRDDGGYAEVTASGRELERQALAMYGLRPSNMPKWRVYVPGFFEYMFIRRSNSKLLTGVNLHDALTVIVECPWPSRAGPRRKGKPPKRK